MPTATLDTPPTPAKDLASVLGRIHSATALLRDARSDAGLLPPYQRELLDLSIRHLTTIDHLVRHQPMTEDHHANRAPRRD